MSIFYNADDNSYKDYILEKIIWRLPISLKPKKFSWKWETDAEVDYPNVTKAMSSLERVQILQNSIPELISFLEAKIEEVQNGN